MSNPVNSCPFCAHNKLNYECRYPEHKNNIVEIFSCNNCGVFIPQYAKEVFSVEEQTTLHENMWMENAKEWTDAKNGMIDMVEKQKVIIGQHESTHLVLDIGAGRGNLTAALKYHGYNVKACEPSEALYSQALQKYELSTEELKNMEAVSFLKEISKSINNDIKTVTVYLWHVLEHIKDSKKILDMIIENFRNKKLNIMIQMPMLKSEYIFPEHYFLVSPDWYQFLSEFTGLKLVDFSWSKKSFYMSGYYSNNENLEAFELKRPFRGLTQFERAYYKILESK